MSRWLTLGALRVREHSSDGRSVLVLHGGPAAVGSAAELAVGLADRYHVFEPWQRGSGEVPLTIARHVDGLHAVVEALDSSTPPVLVGESWGAMLALAYAAEHPSAAGPLVLIGCGTWNLAARERLQATLHERLSGAQRAALRDLDQAPISEAERLQQRYAIVASLYDVDLLPAAADPDRDAEPFDVRAHHETWADMLRLQSEGVYPEAFRRITSPVLMIHGEQDPHPGELIRDSLRPHLPQLLYHPLPRCGHRPWQERAAQTACFERLHTWLAAN